MLHYYLNKEKIDIVMLSEHWLKPNENIVISNYKLLTSCRNNGYGGAAFLINNNLSTR